MTPDGGGGKEQDPDPPPQEAEEKDEGQNKNKTKVKRPDVSARRSNRKNIVDTVVPCCLSSRLGVDFNEECRALLRGEIERWVVTVSQVVHRLSIVFNRFLLYLLKNNIPVPSINDSLMTGLALHGMKAKKKQSKEVYQSLIDAFCDNEFNADYGQYPHIERQRGDCQAIVYACRRYKTNFKNTIHVPFYQRQKTYIKAWLGKEDIQDVKAWEVIKRINGWKTRGQQEELPPRVLNFIRLERRHLGVKDELTDKWLKTNTKKVLSYYYHIMTFYHEHDVGKKFRLAPLCQIKCHFLTVDKVVLRELLANVRKQAHEKKILFPPDISEAIDKKEMTDAVWKAVFNYDGLRRRRRFSHMVDTNGTKVCFHFQTTKKTHLNRKKRVEQKRKKQPHTRIISIDPGRSNLVTAYDDGKDTFYRLTRRQYYKSSGMLERNKNATTRNLRMKHVYEAMSKTPTRSIMEKDWYNYQMIVTRWYDELWEFKTMKVWRKEEMRVSVLKEKCLDKFFDRFRDKDLPEPVMAYGAASFSPTGKGELAVPVKYVYQKCCQKYKTVKEDERFSTKMHHKCQRETIRVEVGTHRVRGLRWCTTCRELVPRDPNACKNIMASFKAEERPAYLCGGTPAIGGERVRRLSRCNQKSKKKEAKPKKPKKRIMRKMKAKQKNAWRSIPVRNHASAEESQIRNEAQGITHGLNE